MPERYHSILLGWYYAKVNGHVTQIWYSSNHRSSSYVRSANSIAQINGIVSLFI